MYQVLKLNELGLRQKKVAFATTTSLPSSKFSRTSFLPGSTNTQTLLIDFPGSASRKRMAPCASCTIYSPSMLSRSGTLVFLPSLINSSKLWLAALATMLDLFVGYDHRTLDVPLVLCG